MGNGGSKGSGGGSGSKGNSICGIDRRDIRSITHEYHDRPFNKNKDWGSSCIKGHRATKWDCFVEHYRDSYPSGHSNSRGGEGSGSSGTDHGSSSQSTYSSGDNYIVQALTINEWQNFGYIDFSGKQLGDDSCRVLNEAFRDARLPNLLTLVLSNNQISDSGGQYLAYSLIHHYNNNLTTLILANNDLTNNGVTPFADAFNQINTTTFSNGAISRGQITKLKTLDLRGNSKICFSGKLYFFQGIDKCKTKDTSILFDEFTIKTGDIHSLTSNNKLLNDSHIPWITGAFHYQWLASIHNLNLGNNQIGDGGAKLLADSLAKGEMPNLKKLHLEGNKITDEGETALVKAMKGKAQDIIILTQRVDITKKMISGAKEEKIAIYKDLIEKGKAKGTYDEALVIDKSLWGEIKNSGKILKVVTNASIGFTKCYFAPEDIAVDYAQNKIMAKLPKMINGVLNYAAKLVDLENVFTCYVDASEDAWTSAVGQQAVKHELCVVGETEFCGE